MWNLHIAGSDLACLVPPRRKHRAGAKVGSESEAIIMEEDGFIIVSRDRCDAEVVARDHRHQDPWRLAGKYDVGVETTQIGLRDDAVEFLSEIHSVVEGLRDSLWTLNNFIHENPELAFKEYKAHHALTSFMRSRQNWHVTTSAYGMETAWVAVYDSGRKGPTVSFNAEMGKWGLSSVKKESQH